MIKRETLSMNELTLYLHIKDVLSGNLPPNMEKQFAKSYLRKLLKINYNCFLSKDLDTAEGAEDFPIWYSPLWAEYRSKMLWKFKRKSNGAYELPDKVLDYLLLKGDIFPLIGSKDFFAIYDEYKKKLERDIDLNNSSYSNEEKKNKLVERCRSEILDDLSARECASKLYYDYLQKKKQHTESNLIKDNVDDPIQRMLDRFSNYIYAVRKDDIDIRDIEPSQVRDKIIETRDLSTVFNKKKYFETILSDFKPYIGTNDSGNGEQVVKSYLTEVAAYRFDFEFLKNKNEIMEMLEPYLLLFYKQSQVSADEDVIKQQVREQHFLFTYRMDDIPEQSLINIICSSSERYDEKYKKQVESVLSQMSILYLPTCGLILDNYIEFLTEQARFRLAEFGEDLAKYYLKNRLSESIVYRKANPLDFYLTSDNNKNNDLVDRFRDDFDIDRDAIYSTVCETLGMGYSDPTSPITRLEQKKETPESEWQL